MHIAVVGGSGSGKTWLAERLCSAFAPGATRLSLDDFYHDLSALPMEARERVNFDDPAAIDWGAVRQAMEALSDGNSAFLPAYDFATHTRLASRRWVASNDLLVWDGLWLLHDGWLRDRFTLTFFVDCTVQERLARRQARDVRERGRLPDAVRRQFEEQVEPMHEKFVQPQRAGATRCVNSPLSEQALELLLGEARACLQRPEPQVRPER